MWYDLGMNHEILTPEVPLPIPDKVLSKAEHLGEGTKATLERILRPGGICRDLSDFEDQMNHVRFFTRTSAGELSFATRFTESWNRLDAEQTDKLREILGGKESVLVDLGGGLMPRDIPRLAKKIGVRTYVDVDIRFTDTDLSGELPVTVFGSEKIYMDREVEMDSCAVGDDLLRFLSRLNNESVSLVISGIDENIIINPKYIEELWEQTQRVVPENGLIIGGNSVIYRYLKKNPNFEEVFDGKSEIEETRGLMFAFRKKAQENKISPEVAKEHSFNFIYPHIEGDLAALEDIEDVSSEKIAEVIGRYWSTLVRNHINIYGDDELLDMKKACEIFKGRFGNYVLNGSLIDLLDKRARIIFSMFSGVSEFSPQIIEDLQQRYPKIFPSDAVEVVREMASYLNHNFKGSVQTIIFDAAEKLKRKK